MDARLPPEVARPLPRPPDADLGLADARRGRLRRHPLLRPRLRRAERSWDDVPEDVKKTFDRLGIPEAERKFLAGVGAQYESESVYHQVNEQLEAQGVVFMDMDTALREHPDLVHEYIGTLIPPNDNKLAALNSAVWSGGSFVYVPPGVQVEMPLQAYFRINTENMGQFERTIIIADEGSYVHYVEGCTAPTYSSDSLHSAVVELFAKPGARIRYTTVQNWSGNVFNLVTKRATAERDATVEWVDCNLGSKLTMKYPSVYLMGERAHGEILSIAFAGNGQHQDAGGKIIHAAPNTTSNIFAKSISKDGGRSSYRGLLEVAKGAHGSKSKVVCDALLLDEDSRSDTYPTIRIGEDDVERRPRGHRLEGRRGAALLPPVARHRRGGGLEAHRQRLHRADRQGAPDGVRGRDEPPHRAPDGGLDWLVRRHRLADLPLPQHKGDPGLGVHRAARSFDLAVVPARRRRRPSRVEAEPVFPPPERGRADPGRRRLERVEPPPPRARSSCRCRRRSRSTATSSTRTSARS